MAPNSRTLLNLIMATDISQRTRGTLEFGASVALLMVLATLAIERFESYVVQSQAVEAFGLTSTVRGEMLAYRAEHGHWPLKDSGSILETLAGNSSTYVDRIAQGQDGALTTIFSEDHSALRLRGRRLTIRPLTHSTNTSSPVSWVCGPHRYPPELTPGGIDETDIDSSDLPSVCREY